MAEVEHLPQREAEAAGAGTAVGAVAGLAAIGALGVAMAGWAWSLLGQWLWTAALALMLHAGAASAADTPRPGDALRGQVAYESRCGACHAPQADRVGPRHAGIVGRRAGSREGYSYSAALARSELRWTPANLERWLADPEALVPGQRMGFRVDDAQTRADIVAYLATLKD